MHCFCKKIKTHHCKVVLLDEQELIKEIQDNTRGQEILDIVFSHLNLIETAYFGLRYLDASNQTHWLDPAKKIVKQLKGTNPFSLYFGVKFYAADPCKLLEEITRYQFFLQVKQDILQGRLPISFDIAAELGAYVVQSELGDYDPRRHSIGYVSEFRFLSNQTAELESRIEELHKGLIGQLPAQAELSYLDKVKWLEMYGVDLHPVLGEDNVEYFLGLTPSGIIVLRNKNKVGHYYWPRISKIYFKGRYFMVRICDKNNEENTYGFETPSKPACKHLWKCCVEHHAFFRLLQVSPATPDIFSLGSRFRYSGRTEKQAQADAQMRLRNPPQFSRTPSRRYQRRMVEGAAEVTKLEDYTNRENIPPQELKMVSIPQPVTSMSLYRSTCSIPAALPSHNRSESPRRTRSAPWTGHIRGLYNSKTSPRSVRSADHTTQLLHKLTQRSSSVDSQSSNDSRSCKRHRRHRSRRGSDNESELSKCSRGSHHRHRRRSHGKREGSESEKDHHHHHRHRHKSGGSSRRSRHGSNYELVDSEAQWKEVQRRQAEGSSGVHQATVVVSNKDRRSGYMNSGMETESEMSYHHKRKQKKHRSRSRSPSEGGKGRLPDELKKHLEFKLIDTDGMSESQLREIPYTVIETSTITKGHRKHSPSSKRKHVSRKSKSSSKDEICKNGTVTESPPPPYTPTREDNHSNDLSQTNKNSIVHISSGDSGHFSNTGPGSNSSSTSNSALGEFLSKNPPNSNHGGSGSSTHSPSGSVSTRNSNQILPRSNRTLSEYRSPSLQNISSSNHFSSSLVYSPNRKHPVSNKTFANSSALYGNPTTLLGNLNDNNQILRISNPNLNNNNNNNSNSNNNNNHNKTATQNEADDSGLSFDSQEYVYSKNRSRPAQATQTKTSQVNKKPGDKSGLPPLPYVQYNKQRSAYDRKSDVGDLKNNKQQSNGMNKQVENGGSHHWNGAPDNNNSEYTRRDGTSSTRSDASFNEKRRRGPLYYQQQPSPRVLRNSNNLNISSSRPDRNSEDLMAKRRSASLELILSPIIKSTYQQTVVQ